MPVNDTGTRLTAFGQADARPGLPPQEGSARLEAAFAAAYRDGAAGRDPKAWTSDAQDYCVQPITVQEGDQEWQVSWGW